MNPLDCRPVLARVLQFCGYKTALSLTCVNKQMAASVATLPVTIVFTKRQVYCDRVPIIRIARPTSELINCMVWTLKGWQMWTHSMEHPDVIIPSEAMGIPMAIAHERSPLRFLIDAIPIDFMYSDHKVTDASPWLCPVLCDDRWIRHFYAPENEQPPVCIVAAGLFGTSTWPNFPSVPRKEYPPEILKTVDLIVRRDLIHKKEVRVAELVRMFRSLRITHCLTYDDDNEQPIPEEEKSYSVWSPDYLRVCFRQGLNPIPAIAPQTLAQIRKLTIVMRRNPGVAVGSYLQQCVDNLPNLYSLVIKDLGDDVEDFAVAAPATVVLDANTMIRNLWIHNTYPPLMVYWNAPLAGVCVDILGMVQFSACGTIEGMCPCATQEHKHTLTLRIGYSPCIPHRHWAMFEEMCVINNEVDDAQEDDEQNDEPFTQRRALFWEEGMETHSQCEPDDIKARFHF